MSAAACKEEECRILALALVPKGTRTEAVLLTLGQPETQKAMRKDKALLNSVIAFEERVIQRYSDTDQACNDEGRKLLASLR